MNVAPLPSGKEREAAALWEACGLTVSYNPPLEDIDFARASKEAEILVGTIDDRIVASVMVGHDGHRGWMYYVAVSPEYQGQGLGAEIVHAAEAWLRAKGVRKVQLLVRNSNLKVKSFYERLGYDESPSIVMQRWLIDDPRQG